MSPRQPLVPSSYRLIQNATDVATELIRQAIVEGRLAPGQRLKEEELARELGVSRTPVREALLVLEAERLIESQPKRGAVVRSLGPQEIRDVYELRSLLEGHAAERAALKISARELTRLKRSNERFAKLRQSDDVLALVGENLVFHQVILEAAGNGRLHEMVTDMTKLPLVSRAYYWYTTEQKLIAEHYHRQITRALEERDGERAGIIMKEHVLEARDVLLAGMATDGPSGRDGPSAVDRAPVEGAPHVEVAPEED